MMHVISILRSKIQLFIALSMLFSILLPSSYHRYYSCQGYKYDGAPSFILRREDTKTATVIATDTATATDTVNAPSVSLDEFFPSKLDGTGTSPHSIVGISSSDDSHISKHGLRFLQEVDVYAGETAEGKPKPWGFVFGATILVNSASLLGIFFLIKVPFRGAQRAKQQQEEDHEKTIARTRIIELVVPSFATGALIATAFFLTIPEAMVLIQQSLDENNEDVDIDVAHNHDDVEGGSEAEAEEGFELRPGTIWRFGTSIVMGFLFPIIMAIFFPHNHDSEHEHVHCDIEEEYVKVGEPTAKHNSETFDEIGNSNSSQSGDTVDKIDKNNNDTAHSNNDVSNNIAEICNINSSDITKENNDPINMRIVVAVLAGDGLCNFADGVFIGVAVSSCNASIAWAVIGVSLYHEVAQELADFFLLTKVAGLSTWMALLVNFTTGLSVVCGGFLVLMIDLSNMSMGVLLGLGSGIYLYIACCECIPRVHMVSRHPKEIMISLALFAAGAIPIGLTLLGHVHCDAH